MKDQPSPTGDNGAGRDIHNRPTPVATPRAIGNRSPPTKNVRPVRTPATILELPATLELTRVTKARTVEAANKESPHPAELAAIHQPALAK